MDRRAFVAAFARRTILIDGQTCVPISFPDERGRFAYYDMDGGEIHRISTAEAETIPRGRETEESDFFFSAILDSKYTDEASAIWYALEEERDQ